MADTFFIEGLNTLPEQVQLNKDDIKTNTADIAKLKDDIGKIKPNAWEKNTSIIEGGYTFEQYIPTDFNSDIPYSFVKYNIDKSGNPISQNIGLMAGKLIDSTGINHPSLQLILSDSSNIDINETDISFHFGIDTSTIEMKYENNDAILFLDNTRFQLNKGEYITEFSNSDVHDYHQILTAFAVNEYYLKKTNASTTYATKTELSNANKRIDALDTGTFDIDLTTTGLAKIKANVTIGSPITLTKDTDFSEYIDGVDTFKTILFSIYTDQSEDYYISADIKLDVGYTEDVYGDKEQNYTWLTGIGVIKLGPNTNGNNYLCYISYSQGYTSPLIITPVQKLS
nr:MAG TPA: hypothetical protein [Caudoviricetes sp.]